MVVREPLLPEVPPNMPLVPPQRRFSRWFGRTVLRLGGWRVVGTIPDLPKLVLIAAPQAQRTVQVTEKIVERIVERVRERAAREKLPRRATVTKVSSWSSTSGRVVGVGISSTSAM